MGDVGIPRGSRAGTGALLRVRLLGDLDIRCGDARLAPIESARAQSLLARLLLHREAPQPRQRLAFLLWPDSTEAQARTNLRHVLHNLRRALPDPDRYLEAGPGTLRWRPDAPCWLDVAEFEALVARAEADEDGDGGLAALREAVETYAGDLLQGSYDDWLLDDRERLRARYRGALERLTAILEERGDHAGAVAYAERLLRHDPLDEGTCRLLMRLHDARGERSRALRAYHECAATLERELGVEPSTATREAYEALLSSEHGPPEGPPPAARVGSPALIGRAAERRRLTDLWRASEDGRAQLVLLTGEPGVGKTRLAEELRAWCAHRGAMTAEARAYPAEGALAYAPVVEWLRSEPLAGRLGRLDLARLAELSRLLPELLAGVPGLPRPEPLPEGDQRQRLFDAAAGAILLSAGPVLLVADDLQWWDRESLRFVHYLLRVRPRAAVLVAATARREEIDAGHPAAELLAGLTALDRLTEIAVARLTGPETALLGERAAGRPLGEGEAEALHRATEGNPLFVLEATRARWEDGGPGPGWMTPKVQAVIESRIAQLSEPARDLLGVAATIGRELTGDLLAAAGEADEATLVRSLDELWRRGIVREQGAAGYDFGHDRIREVAYRALSPARRRTNHRRVAQALERLDAADPAPVSGRLAAHYEAAGEQDRAVAWYERAAVEAQRLHANVETIRLLRRALGIVRAQPEGAGRDARELAVLTALLTPIGAVEGYASSGLEDARRRALELSRALGAEPEPRVLRAGALASLSAGDFPAARDAGERLRARGERESDAALLVEGAYILGIAAFWGGEPAAAREHFEAAVDRYRPEQRRAHLLNYGLDPEVVCLSRLGNALWLLGRTGDAIRAREAALALAGEIGHPASRGVALVFGAALALDLREPERVREYAASLSAGPGERETPATQVFVEAIGGYIEVLDGRGAAGVDRARRALDDARNVDHAPGMRCLASRVLLEACLAAGDARAGLAAADRALGMGGATVWEAEARRLRAGFLSALGAPREEVGAELARALAGARRQGARALERRAREAAAALA